MTIHESDYSSDYSSDHSAADLPDDMPAQRDDPPEAGFRAVDDEEMEPAQVITDVPNPQDAPEVHKVTDLPAAPDAQVADAPDAYEPPAAPETHEAPSVSVASDASSAPSASDERRWQEILAGFVDDPRASVQAAIELAEDDVSAFLAQLSERREAMRSTPAGGEDARTEGMRKTVIAYRDFSRQLAASKPSL